MATRAGRSRFADADAQSSCGESRVPRGRVARGYASIAPAARLGAVVFARPRKETQADAAASASPLTPAPASTLSRRRAVSSPFASSLTSPAAARDHRSSRAWEGGGVLRCVASPRAEELWASASAWSVEGPGHLRKLAPCRTYPHRRTRSSRALEGRGVLRRVAVRVGDVGVRERVAVERPAGDCRDAAATAASGCGSRSSMFASHGRSCICEDLLAAATPEAVLK